MNVNTMTAEQVRSAIVEALGLRLVSKPANIPTFVDDVYVGTTGEWWAWVDSHDNLAPGEKWTNHKDTPDWPNDAGAALALCATLGDFSLNHCDPSTWPGEWEATIAKKKRYDYDEAHVAYEDTPALALSRLALLALREIKANDA